MKNALIPVLAAALLSVGCDDWTESENMDFRRPTPEEQDPAAYQAYLASIRDYKRQEHKVMMMTVPGGSERPDLQNRHPKMMPDSVDVICMTDYLDLHPTIAEEIALTYDTKGTQTVCVVDYASIQSAWDALEEQKAEAGEPAGTAEEFEAYCREQAESQLACCDRYGFHGIEISYLGRKATEMEKAGQTGFFESIDAWRASHADKTMIIRGYIQNLIDNSILADCDYIVILAGDITAPSELTRAITRKMGEGVPNDRFILEVTVPTTEDPTQVGATPQAAAEWAVTPEGDGVAEFIKAGLAVGNAQYDYFNTVRIYNSIRQAMSIMNPANTGNDHEEIE